MATLHIEHAITDYATWRAAFDRFAEARERAGVTAYRLRRPEDDEHIIIIDLEFPDVASAHRFHGFLQQNVWNDPERSPGLDGNPMARVLVDHA